MVDRLEQLLERDRIEYRESLFVTERGISDLGEEPFVSPIVIIVIHNSCHGIKPHPHSIGCGFKDFRICHVFHSRQTTAV